MSTEPQPADPAMAAPTPTPASLVTALVFFAIAIAAPIIALVSVKDSHDGFEIFGTFLVSLGIGGIAAFIGIVLSIVGIARGAGGAMAWIAGVLSVVSALLLLGALARMAS